MALERFIGIDTSGRKIEKLPIDSSTGASDAGKLVAVDATGRINENMMPIGVAPDVQSCVAGENLVAGNIVNIYLDGATLKCRKADATSIAKKADGFVKDAVSSGDAINVYFEGINGYVTGLTAGTVYFLSDSVAGGLTATPPTTADYILQPIGKALSATSISTEIAEPVIRV